MNTDAFCIPVPDFLHKCWMPKSVKLYFYSTSLFLQLPEYQLYCNLFLLSVGGTLHFFLSMAFREGHLTVALMVFCLEKFSGPKGIGYYNNGAEVLASATLCFSLSLLVALMASLEGAREYQVGSPGTEVAALLLFLF